MSYNISELNDNLVCYSSNHVAFNGLLLAAITVSAVVQFLSISRKKILVNEGTEGLSLGFSHLVYEAILFAFMLTENIILLKTDSMTVIEVYYLVFLGAIAVVYLLVDYLKPKVNMKEQMIFKLRTLMLFVVFSAFIITRDTIVLPTGDYTGGRLILVAIIISFLVKLHFNRMAN